MQVVVMHIPVWHIKKVFINYGRMPFLLSSFREGKGTVYTGMI